MAIFWSQNRHRKSKPIHFGKFQIVILFSKPLGFHITALGSSHRCRFIAARHGGGTRRRGGIRGIVALLEFGEVLRFAFRVLDVFYVYTVYTYAYIYIYIYVYIYIMSKICALLLCLIGKSPSWIGDTSTSFMVVLPAFRVRFLGVLFGYVSK